MRLHWLAVMSLSLALVLLDSKMFLAILPLALDGKLLALAVSCQYHSPTEPLEALTLSWTCVIFHVSRLVMGVVFARALVSARKGEQRCGDVELRVLVCSELQRPHNGQEVIAPSNF